MPPPKVIHKHGKNQQQYRPVGDSLQDSGQLRREGFLKPAPLRTDIDLGKFWTESFGPNVSCCLSNSKNPRNFNIVYLESSQKVFDFGTAKKPSVESEQTIEQIRRRLASNDQDSVFDQEKNPKDESIPSEDGQKAKNRPKFTSTPSKKSKLGPATVGIQPGDPTLSTIYSGKKTTNRNQTLSTENDHQLLSDSNELGNPSPGKNSTASTPKLSRTRSLSRSRHAIVQTRRKTSKNTESSRENYSEFPDFKKELNLGMDPLLACTLLTKVSIIPYNFYGINLS